jgi:hypothetical protein
MCGQPLPEAHGTCRHCGETVAADDLARKKFRWRIIPAFILALYGGMFVLGVPANLAVAAVTGRFNAAEFTDACLLVVPGIVFIAAARLWWTRRWWWAAGTTILSYPVTILAMSFRANL